MCVTGSHSVQRYRHIRVRFHNLRFSMVTMDFEGMDAQIIQHEMDHCNGVLI